MSFHFQKLDIPDLALIKPEIFEDERGFFIETYKRSDFLAANIQSEFIQDNHSKSIGKVLRGLHFQLPPHVQAKLVRCTRGEIFDVAVDLRRGSPTYGKHCSVVLSEENKKMLYVPVGFAHGFFTLSHTTEVCYKVSALYRAESERGIMWNDQDLNIPWPESHPVLSQRDQQWPVLKDFDSPFTYFAKETH
ncbi:MAG: dTDP-4-dehydrorhamnose 3,5-epimerase [Candidatus Omnitrophica bacterium]|nr:dTDP-4-dehydrorhamnose 3,5-epimerase [Candidatus Omnitrophota bacterium]